MAQAKRRTFTKEFKAQTVRLVRESGNSVGTVAGEFDLTGAVVRRWVQQADIEVGQGLAGALRTDGLEELGQLRGEGRTPADGARDPEKSDGLLCRGAPVKFAFIAAKEASRQRYGAPRILAECVTRDATSASPSDTGRSEFP